jgi:hypothetical protein
MDRICVGFQEAQDLKEAGFPQGTSHFVWTCGERTRPTLCARADAPESEEVYDAATVQEIADWNPRAVLIVMPGVNEAIANDRIEVAATLANALARAAAPRR